ncbi:LLM class flavin-dependent oxidoreductase [Ornithinimicrobium sp. Y1694]|uniref:LLM class flavin-dependent oxidoreductase n=1 Tax=Ornithinimicrobium sp. Y1694 TaxID=3418590 RepID=UPI003CF8D92D
MSGTSSPSTRSGQDLSRTPVLALVQPADQPPERMIEAARRAEDAGLEEVWIWEDCFAASGIGPAAAMLAATRELRVGIGLLPVPLRAPSLTAMELASLASMFPGRFLPGLGHGVLDWMGQAGVRVSSPVTLLREHVDAIRRLLHGEEVTTQGRYVDLDRVRLRFPPEVVPPVLVGGRGPRTLALAGELADGIIMDDAAPEGRALPDRVAQVIEIVGAARDEADREGRAEVIGFLPTASDAEPAFVAEQAHALWQAGVDRVVSFAGGVDGPPAQGDEVLHFVDVLAEVADAMDR